MGQISDCQHNRSPTKCGMNTENPQDGSRSDTLLPRRAIAIMRGQPSLNSSRYRRMKMAFAIWLAAGLCCLYVDDMVRPPLAAFGKHAFVATVASAWQEFGGLAAMAAFAAAGLMTWTTDRGKTARQFLAALFVAALAAQIGKLLIGRGRPDWTGGETRFFGLAAAFDPDLAANADSMPSGHTTMAFLMAGMLSVRWPRATWLWISLAIGVAASRILVERHFPSDVILGALLGTTAAIVTRQFVARRSGSECEAPIESTTHSRETLCASVIDAEELHLAESAGSTGGSR